MLYPLFVLGYYNSVVAIYQGDGSVAVSHGGIEMGQGINTKVSSDTSRTNFEFRKFLYPKKIAF